MAYTLTDQERAALNAIRESGSATEGRRAAIVLLSADGEQTSVIARTVDLSPSQVRHWRREWRAHRLDIFPSLSGPAEDAAAEDAAPESAVPDAPALIPGVDVPRLDLEERKTIGIQPDDPMAEAGRKALRFHFERMLLNEPGSRLGEDPEAVHDMRVATRRMRSALGIMEPYYKKKAIRPFQQAMRNTARVLGAVRDLDVFIEKSNAFCDAHPGVNLDPIFEVWNTQRRVARNKLIGHLDSKDFAKFVRRFDAFTSTPGKGAQPLPAPADLEPYQVRHIMPGLIYERFEQVRLYDALLDNPSLESLHALRIEFKRLRYLLEFCKEVLGPEVHAVIEQCKTLQDHLGDLNDTHVVIDALTQFVDAHNTEFSGIPKFIRPDIDGVLLYIEAQRDEQHRLLQTFPAVWAAFNANKNRRNLALAIAAL